MNDGHGDTATYSSQDTLARRGIELRGRTVRQQAARGTVVNAIFSIGLALITLLRGLVIARFLTRAEYGVWGILVVSLGSLFMLKQIGVSDKYIQQEGEDEELAFQQAFSAECVVNGVFLIVFLLAVPAVAAIYGRSQLILPGISLALLLPAYTLQAPSWIFYRKMRFGTQRLLQAVDPLIGSITALALAIAGLGYWSLILGLIVGAWASALASIVASPYRLRFRLDRRLLRSYVSFSWPLFVASGSNLLVAQVALFFGTKVTGLAGAGAITLSVNVSQFAERADEIVSGTMYPVICAVQHRVDLLNESFVKSNRAALIWGMPFGVGLSLFGADLIHYVLGTKWQAAEVLLIAFGITAALGQVGFNWDDYFRARGDTRPIAWTGAITAFSFLVSAIPLIYLFKLTGFAIAVIVQVLVNVVCRIFFLRRLFEGFEVVRHAARAGAPTVPAVAAVLVMRALERGSRGATAVIVELALYVLVAVAATWLLERKLLVELSGYLRRSATGEPEREAG